MSGTEYRQIRFVPPPGATELLLIRHGESEAAIEGVPFDLVDGQGDPPLSAVGRDEAERVCARLAGEHIDAIYITSLRRTGQTAAPLAATLGLTPTVEPELREVHLGEWEGGAFRRKVIERDPIAVRMSAEQRWDVIPGAEPGEVFAARVRDAVARIVAAHPDQRVALFTHGGVIGEVLRQVTGSEPFAFAVADNASISHVVFIEGKPILRRYNDTTHLGTDLTVRPEPPT